MLKTYALSLLFIFGLDASAVLGTYFLLPNPTKLVRGVKLERTTADGKRFSFVAGPKNKRYVPLSAISRYLQLSVILMEDAKFYQHRGFDLEEIQNAFSAFLWSRKRLRGASTLTQQLVKNLYLTHERTWRRKFLEALITIKLESLISKPKILEIYLNSIDWGKGLFGVAEATQFYFHKKVGDLDLKEAVFLAAIIPNPSRFSVLDSDQMPKRSVRSQMMRAYESLFKANLITLTQYEEAMLHPFGSKPEPEFIPEPSSRKDLSSEKIEEEDQPELTPP